jgi:hypothetical protein
MIRRSLAAVVCCFMAASVLEAWGQSRNPTRFSCRAAKNLAVVGAWDGDGVLVVERTQDQECRFSINGAPAGTPPLDRVTQGWNFISRGGFSTSASLPVEPLAYALSAAAPYETIAPGLQAAISKNATALLNCFGARDTGRPFEVSSGDLICKVVNEPTGGLLQVNGSPGVEFFARAGIQLGIRAENTVHYLFMPMPRRN